MSYIIIKKIREENGKVIILSASNNVYPHIYHEYICESLSKILQEQGRLAFDLEVLKAYESGQFQRGSNRHTRNLEKLQNMPEYDLFNWRLDPYEEIQARRKTEAFNQLLLKAIATKLPPPRFYLSKVVGDTRYFAKINKRSITWYESMQRITKKRYRRSLEKLKNYDFDMVSKDWEILEV